MAVTFLGVVGSTAVVGTSFSIPVDITVPVSTRETARHVLVFLQSSGNPGAGEASDDAALGSSPFKHCPWFPPTTGAEPGFPISGGNGYAGVVFGGPFTMYVALIINQLEPGNSINVEVLNPNVDYAYALAYEGAWADTDEIGFDFGTFTRKVFARALSLIDGFPISLSPLVLVDGTFYNGDPDEFAAGADGVTWTTESRMDSRTRYEGGNDPYYWETEEGGKILTLSTAAEAGTVVGGIPVGADEVTGWEWENDDYVTRIDFSPDEGPFYILGEADLDVENPEHPPIGGTWTGPTLPYLGYNQAVGTQAFGFVLRPGEGPEACPGAIAGTVIISTGDAEVETEPPAPFGPAAAGRISFPQAPA